MKKIIALAVFGAFAAPAFADSGNVTIDGYVRAYYEHDNDVQAGSTASQNKINGRGEVHFSGSEDLGNGNSAIFKVGTRFNSDGGTSITNNGTFGNQVTYVGMKGAWGTATLGNVADNYSDGKYSNGVVIDESPRGSMIGSLHATNGAVSNGARYDLPAMGSFTSSAVWHFGEDKSSSAKASDSYTLRGDYDTDNWGLGATYEGGRLSSTNDKYSKYDLTGAVTFGAFQVGAEYDAFKDKDTSMKNRTTGLYLNYGMDKWNFGLQYWSVKDTDSTSLVAKAKTWELLANYAMSKRTKLFAEYLSGKVKYTNGDLTADPHAATQFVVGMKHSF